MRLGSLHRRALQRADSICCFLKLVVQESADSPPWAQLEALEASVWRGGDRSLDSGESGQGRAWEGPHGRPRTQGEPGLCRVRAVLLPTPTPG